MIYWMTGILACGKAQIRTNGRAILREFNSQRCTIARSRDAARKLTRGTTRMALGKAAACSRSPAHARGPVHRLRHLGGHQHLGGLSRCRSDREWRLRPQAHSRHLGLPVGAPKPTPGQVVRRCGRRLHSRLPGHRRSDGGIDAAAQARHQRICASVSRRTHVRAACPARTPRVCQPRPAKLASPYQVMRLNADSYESAGISVAP